MSEVFITDWRVVDTEEMRFLCGAQWPRKHVYFRPGGGRHNTLLIAESLRQAGTLLAHVALGVPEDTHFVMEDVQVDVTGDAAVTEAPAEVLLDIRVPTVVRRAGRVRRCHIDVDFQCDGDVLARASMTIGFVPHHAYDRLRWRGRSAEIGPTPDVAPMPPALVGVTEPDDVVIGPASDHSSWPLRVPGDHPTFFDHSLDHVPGMLALEALRQCARASVGMPDTQMVRCEAVFEHYLDLDAPITVSVDVLPSPHRTETITVLVCFEQYGRKAAEGVAVMSRPEHTQLMACAAGDGFAHPLAEPSRPIVELVQPVAELIP